MNAFMRLLAVNLMAPGVPDSAQQALVRLAGYGPIGIAPRGEAEKDPDDREPVRPDGPADGRRTGGAG